MKGLGIIKGLTVTFSHFIQTYLQDIKGGKKRYYTDEGVQKRSSSDTEGIFTIQYPEEKLPTPEEFRYLPILLYEEKEDGSQVIRCTACGICSQVCPPQCIWIEREVDKRTGRPKHNPSEFFIDVDICMNCGLCSEYCPFDSIKMDHDYEIATLNRFDDNIYNLEKLLRPVSYYAEIRPMNYAKEESAKAEKISAIKKMKH